VELSAFFAHQGLEDTLPLFRKRAHDWDPDVTWRMQRNGVEITSRCYYILASDSRIISNCQVHEPRLLSSDHRLVMGCIKGALAAEHKRYLKGRSRFPLRSQKWGPHRLVDSLFPRLQKSLVNEKGLARP
jgi:hypothetical protein